MEDQSCVLGTHQDILTKGVDINVVADPKPGGGIDWSIDIKTSGHGKNGKIDLPKDHNYEMAFTLVDNTALNLRFDASGPIFARDGGAGPCPTSISTAQIMVASCDSKKLVVTDWNFGAPTDLYYQLNFVNKTGLTKYAYDPIILNGGGGTPP